MEGIVVGIDLSRKYYDVSCLDPGGEVVLDQHRYAYTPAGMRQMRQTVAGLIEEHGYDGAEVAAESTGLLWFHLMADLAQHEPDYALYLLNPRDVRKFIQAMGEEDKTDAKDAYGVADRQRVRRPEHELRLDMPYLALQRLTRYRFSLVQQLASEKVRLTNFVYLKASAYMTVKPFSDIFGATSRQVLSGELTLDELAALPTAELAEQLQAYGRQRFAAPEQRAALLKQVAAESFPLPAEMVAAVDTVLDVGLAHIGGLEQHMLSAPVPIRSPRVRHTRIPHFHVSWWRRAAMDNSYGLLNLDHLFQHLYLDLEGYRLYA